MCHDFTMPQTDQMQQRLPTCCGMCWRRRWLASKEPASIIAAQLPQTAPRVAGLIQGVFGPAARGAQVVPTVSAGRQVEGKLERTRSVEPGLIGG